MRGSRIRRVEPTQTSNLSGLWSLNEIADYLAEEKWPTVPGAPTGLTTVLGNGQVSLSWTAPVANGGSSIVNYIIEYSSDSGVSWNLFNDGVISNTTAVVNNLVNNTTYSFRVAAVNNLGVGPYSNTASDTPEEPLVPVEITSALSPGYAPADVNTYSNASYSGYRESPAATYDFFQVKPLRITKYRIEERRWSTNPPNLLGITSWKLQASNDNINWIDLHVGNRSRGYTRENTTMGYYYNKSGNVTGSYINSSYSEFTFTNSSYYKFHRIVVLDSEQFLLSCGKGGCYYSHAWSHNIKIYGAVNNNTIVSDNLVQTSIGSFVPSSFPPRAGGPDRTQKPAGLSAFAVGDNLNISAIILFDGLTGSISQSRYFNSNYPNIIINFPTPVTIASYKFWGGIDADYNQRYANYQPIKNWQIYGSNNRSTWVLLDTQTNQMLPEIGGRFTGQDKSGSFTRYTSQNRDLSTANTYVISNPTPYYYYKITATGPDYYSVQCYKYGCIYNYGFLNDIQLIGSY